MITVDDARATLSRRLRQKRGVWATADRSQTAEIALALKPPTEREMRKDQAAAEAWVQGWRSVRSGASIDWEERSWRTIGKQRLPVRARFENADAVAEFLGGADARAWRCLRGRVEFVRGSLGSSVAARERVQRVLSAYAERILAYSDSEFDTVLMAANWLVAHPVSGLRPRQLPIRGVDTKWFARHRGMLTALVDAATEGRALGIVDADPLVRLRILDPGASIGGLTDIAAPVSQLERLPIAARVVFVFENLESVLAMPHRENAIVVHGSGYAVDVISRLPWVRDASVVYWGDLDSNGFAILHRLRSSLPNSVSVLMDSDTLLAHRDLWVTEPTPHRGRFDTLTPGEQRALDALVREGDVRLEQERIPWKTAITALDAAVPSA